MKAHTLKHVYWKHAWEIHDCKHCERFWEHKNAVAASVTCEVIDLVEAWRMSPFLFSCWIMQDATCYGVRPPLALHARIDAEAFSRHQRRLTQAVMSALDDDDFYAEAKLTNGPSYVGKPVRNHRTTTVDAE